MGEHVVSKYRGSCVIGHVTDLIWSLCRTWPVQGRGQGQWQVGPDIHMQPALLHREMSAGLGTSTLGFYT